MPLIKASDSFIVEHRKVENDVKNKKRLLTVSSFNAESRERLHQKHNKEKSDCGDTVFNISGGRIHANVSRHTCEDTRGPLSVKLDEANTDSLTLLYLVYFLFFCRIRTLSCCSPRLRKLVSWVRCVFRVLVVSVRPRGIFSRLLTLTCSQRYQIVHQTAGVGCLFAIYQTRMYLCATRSFVAWDFLWRGVSPKDVTSFALSTVTLGHRRPGFETTKKHVKVSKLFIVFNVSWLIAWFPHFI